MGISFFQAQVEELTTFSVLRWRDFCRNERNERSIYNNAVLHRDYTRLDDVSGYVRTKGFDKIQQHQMVLSALVAGKQKKITREDVVGFAKSPQPKRTIY